MSVFGVIVVEELSVCWIPLSVELVMKFVQTYFLHLHALANDDSDEGHSVMGCKSFRIAFNETKWCPYAF